MSRIDDNKLARELADIGFTVFAPYEKDHFELNNLLPCDVDAIVRKAQRQGYFVKKTEDGRVLFKK